MERLERPLHVRLHDRARLCGADQHIERRADYCQLCLGVAGGSQGRAIRKTHAECPWGLDVVRDISVYDDAHSRDTLLLDGTCDQSDGLLADRSARCEEGGVRPICFQPQGHLWRGLVDQLLRFRQIAHEAVRPG